MSFPQKIDEWMKEAEERRAFSYPRLHSLRSENHG